MLAVLFFLICFLQPICLPLPEVTTVLWGSMKLGSTQAFILGYIGSVLGILCMYKFSTLLFAKLRDNPKVLQYIALTERNRILVTGLLFVIPVLPDEIVCVGAGVLNMASWEFLLLALFFKGISVSSIAFSQELSAVLHLPQWGLVSIEIAVLLLITICFKMKNKNVLAVQ